MSSSEHSDEDVPKRMESLDPRVSLANERTFLAWIRTSLGFIAAGLAIAHLLPGDQDSVGARLLGLSSIGAGATMAILGHRRWRRNQQDLSEGRPLSPSKAPAVTTALIMAGAVAAAVFTAWRMPW